MISINCNALINYFNVDQINCFDRPRCLVSDNLRKGSCLYYLLFSDFYNLHYGGSYENFLDEKTGISFEVCMEEEEKFEEILIQKLTEYKNFIIQIDLYYSQENKEYYKRKEHHKHFVVITQYDNKTKVVGVLDEKIGYKYSSDSKGIIYEENTIDIEKLKTLACNLTYEGQATNPSASDLKGKYFSYQIAKCKQDNKSLMCLTDIFGEYKKYLHYILLNSNQIFLAYMENIETYMMKLSKGYDNPSFFPFPKEICSYMSHYHAITTQYMFFKLTMKECEEKKNIIIHFVKAISIGYKIKALLMKSYYSKKEDCCLRILDLYIKELQSSEKNLQRIILSFIEGLNESKSYEHAFTFDHFEIDKEKNYLAECILDSKQQEVACNLKKLIVDIQEYQNNNGICFDILNSTADLTGEGKSILIDCYIDEEYSKKGFYNFDNDKNDNIMCMGQRIILEQNNYCQISLVGCSEWGNYVETLKIIYEKEEVDEIVIGFSDFALNKRYGEDVVVTGKVVMTEDGKKTLMEHSGARLYKKTYLLNSQKKVCGIILPDCKEMHIFAIELTISN